MSLASGHGDPLDNVFVPIGHGGEDITKPKERIPPGCTLVMLTTCLNTHIWPDSGLPQQLNLRKFLNENPMNEYIFSEPLKHTHVLNEIFGNCAYYKAGDEYPNITYSLNLRWPLQSWRLPKSYRYSGLIPFKTFVSPEEETGFHTRDIIETGFSWDHSIPNYREVYKYSIQPKSSQFPPVDSTDEIFIKYLRDLNDPETNDDLDKMADLDEKTQSRTIKMIIRNSITLANSGAEVSLSELMKKFPGTYYHFVCRGILKGDFPNNLKNRRRHSFHLFRKPFMSPKKLENITEENIYSGGGTRSHHKKYRKKTRKRSRYRSKV